MISKTLLLVIVLATAFMCFTALLMLLIPHWLVVPFLDAGKSGAAEVAQLAMVFLFYAAIFQIVDGVQVVGVSILRGLRDTRVPMMFAGLGTGSGAVIGAIVDSFHVGQRTILERPAAATIAIAPILTPTRKAATVAVRW